MTLRPWLPDFVVRRGRAGTYLSHQLGEVRAVPGRQPEQRARAGVQRRAVAHDQDDACWEEEELKVQAGTGNAFTRLEVPTVPGVRLPHGAPTP